MKIFVYILVTVLVCLAVVLGIWGAKLYWFDKSAAPQTQITLPIPANHRGVINLSVHYAIDGVVDGITNNNLTLGVGGGETLNFEVPTDVKVIKMITRLESTPSAMTQVLKSTPVRISYYHNYTTKISHIVQIAIFPEFPPNVTR